jgi:Malectin domain
MTHSDVGLAAVKRELEKHELETILSSGIFDRAPNLENLLRYVCGKYFDGATNEIKEYSIAVDALGRPPDFDQKRDSIVRVEAHRLRKRLRDYYAAGGALHKLRLEIPSGQYAPRFVPQEPALPDSGDAPAVPALDPIVPEFATSGPPDEIVPPVALETRKRWGWRTPAVAALIVFVLSAGAAVIHYASPGVLPQSSPARPAAMPAVAPGSQEVRLLAGLEGGRYTDRSGRVWESDRYYHGGSIFDSGDRPIAGTREPRLYETRREGDFSYDIPLAPGVYELRLYFAETLYGEGNAGGGGETSRLFDILINGKPILRDFDVIGEVGPTAADIRAFKDIMPAADGKLHLKFEKDTNPAFVNAIEITPGTPGSLRPIRIVSRDREYTDKEGRAWEPDRYVSGGQLMVRTQPVETTGDPELFRGERFGNLHYAIPVAPGRYAVTLYFAEAWFGPGAAAGGGAGSRLFDIVANGLLLRRAFDIFKEAQGSHRAVTFTGHGLEPDAQGKLEIWLHPVRNYACVDAIEVVDESAPGGSGS